MDQLSALLQEMRSGHGRTVLVSGEAGVGKSAVIRDFAQRARGLGVRAFTGECTEIEARRPFGPFMDIARAADRLASLPVAPPDAATAGADRYRLHSFFATLFADLARERPAVIVVEDLHWADEASLELFPHLARKLRSAPVLLVGSYRSDELHGRHPLRPMLSELGHARLALDIPLRRLSEDEVEEFLRAALRLNRLPTPEFRRAIFETCEGNPLFMEEVLRALAERGDVEYREGSWHRTKEVSDIAIPDTLRDAVLERFRYLTVETRDVLRYAAVIGQNFDFDLLLKVTGSDDADLVSALRASIDAQLIVESEDPEGADCYSFRHALTRESILLEFLKRERRRAHAIVGAALESRAGTSVARNAEELAYHFDEAGDNQRAFRYHDLAASESYRLFAFARAARHLERALELAGEEESVAQMQLRLADAANLAGMTRRALGAAEDARRCFEEAGDARGVGVALTSIAAIRWMLGEASSARDAAEVAARLLEPLGRSQELAGAYAQVARLAYLQVDYAAAADWGQRAVALARDQKAVRIEADSLITLGSADGVIGRSQGVARLREGIDLASAHDLVDVAMRGFHNLTVTLHAIGSSGAETQLLYEEMFAYARRHGFRTEGAISDEAFYVFARGDWDAVLRLIREAPGRQSVWTIQLQVLEAFIVAGRVGPEQSLPLLDSPRRAFRATGEGHRIFDASILGRVTLLAGDARTTLEILDEIAADVRRGTYPEVDEAAVCALTAAIAQEDRAALDRWIEFAVVDDGGFRRVPGRARRAVAQAERAAEQGELDRSILLLGDGAELFRQSFLPFAETLARRRRVELLLRRGGVGDREAAQAELAAILPYWRKAKAEWYLGQLARWATDHGLILPVDAAATTAPHEADTRFQLTAREREVAGLVASGLSNKQIGEKLVISERTAEGHVERILSKLGFRSRAQIASWRAGGDPSPNLERRHTE
jgi:DNA-binding CsgD family transcriptional regulator/tetratricopeptide (TPR) repeat protein